MGKNTTHKPASTCYCELALKSSGMRVIHQTRGAGDGGAGVETARAREVART
jgi:hypothetical protein